MVKKYNDDEISHLKECQDCLTFASRELDFIQSIEYNLPPDDLAIELLKKDIDNLYNKIDYILEHTKDGDDG